MSDGTMQYLRAQRLRVSDFFCLLIAVSATPALAAEPPVLNPITYARQVTFELTFHNRDLIWFGDAASPTALVYFKPGAMPIATDAYVTTLTIDLGSPRRQYIRESRIDASKEPLTVYAFTKEREQIIGTIDAQHAVFVPNDFYRSQRELLPSWPVDTSKLQYDSHENLLFYDVEVTGPVVTESLDFLPLELALPGGKSAAGEFAIGYVPAKYPGEADAGEMELTLQNGKQRFTLASGKLPRVFRRGDVRLESFDNKSGTYLPEAAYRPGAKQDDGATPSVTFVVAGGFTQSVNHQGKSLVVDTAPAAGDSSLQPPAKIVVDGNFDDWRNVSGVDDPRGDVVPYLEYVTDVDLLELKVSNDDEHIYLYARVAGQVGRSIAHKGCSYFYAYMDVDQDAGTGFLPTRDDDCYFGVEIGDDCEVQFEFVDSVFRKTFYGFCGIGGDSNVLKQEVTLGKSQYGRIDENGAERANYKSEYILRGGATEITEDFKLGTSDTIRLAISPDGREVEVVSSLAGFLKSPEGRPTLSLGQTVDIAVGMECDGKRFEGKQRWAADSTRPVRGYVLRPSGR